jgi:hypothetical protein
MEELGPTHLLVTTVTSSRWASWTSCIHTSSNSLSTKSFIFFLPISFMADSHATCKMTFPLSINSSQGCYYPLSARIITCFKSSKRIAWFWHCLKEICFFTQYVQMTPSTSVTPWHRFGTTQYSWMCFMICLWNISKASSKVLDYEYTNTSMWVPTFALYSKTISTPLNTIWMKPSFGVYNVLVPLSNYENLLCKTTYRNMNNHKIKFQIYKKN